MKFVKLLKDFLGLAQHRVMRKQLARLMLYLMEEVALRDLKLQLSMGCELRASENEKALSARVKT